MSLTNRQRAFIEHYLECWNATEAARRAGYSPRTANEQAARLLANVSMRSAIDARLAQLKMGADEVLTRLTEHARGSIDDFLAGDNLDFEGARSQNKMRLVHKYKRRTWTDQDGNTTSTIELELYDAQSALVQLGKVHGLFLDRTRNEDWRDEWAQLLREGKTNIAELESNFGAEVAREIAARAGVSIERQPTTVPGPTP